MVARQVTDQVTPQTEEHKVLCLHSTVGDKLMPYLLFWDAYFFSLAVHVHISVCSS